MPDAAAFAERVRALALSFPQAYEDAPWGHPAFKVADNRLFALMSVDERSLRLTVKLTPEEREMAYLFPFVRRASHVGRYGWVTVVVSDDDSLALALEWLRESYWLKAPAALRVAVEGD